MIAIKKENGKSNIRLCDGKERFFETQGYTILDKDDVEKIIDIVSSDFRLHKKVKFAKMPPLEEIISYCCSIMNMKEDDVIHNYKKRKRELVFTRYLIMYVCRWFNYGTLQHIGEIFGKDHSTCIHGCQAIEAIIDTKDKYFYPYVIDVMNKFQMYK